MRPRLHQIDDAQQEDLPVAELEAVANLYRWRYVGDPEIVAVATVNANSYSDADAHPGNRDTRLRAGASGRMRQVRFRRASSITSRSLGVLSACAQRLAMISPWSAYRDEQPPY